jgi:hypothetical protein
MGLIYRVACLLGWHKWWDAGEGELVCLECGGSARALSVGIAPVWIKVRNAARIAVQRERSEIGAGDLSRFSRPTRCLAMRTPVRGTRWPPDAPAAPALRA